MTNPIRDTDDEARQLARSLLSQARHAALAVIGPNGAPFVSRIALTCDPLGQPLTLMSDLSMHRRALAASPVCSLLVGEVGDKGDPLTHPRLTLQCRAHPVVRGTREHQELRAQ